MASVRDYPPAPGGHLQDAAQEIWGAEAQERKKGLVTCASGYFTLDLYFDVQYYHFYSIN